VAMRRAGLTAEVLAIGIDPAEGPAEAARTKAEQGAEEGWHFLTGDATALRNIEETIGFTASYDPVIKQYLHPAGLVLATPDGRLSDYLLGLGYDPQRLAAGLRAAAAGKIAVPAPAIRLFCFRYDPISGRYSLAVLQALKIAAGAASLILAAALWRALRRERPP